MSKRKPGPPEQDGAGITRFRSNPRYEEMVANTLREQEAAMAAARGEPKPRQRRDRSSYKDYPPPKK